MDSSKRRSLVFFWLGASLLAALPAFFSFGGVIAASGRGSLASAGLAPAGWGDRLVFWGMQAGGMFAARLALAVQAFFFWALVLALAGALIIWLSRKFRPALQRPLLLSLVVLVSVMGVVSTFLTLQRDRSAGSLLVPYELIRQARAAGGAVFINPSAVGLIGSVAPDLIAGPSLRERGEIAASPVLWRQLDRKSPMRAVLIAGRTSEARLLIRHLLAAPDWHLADIDEGGILFVRGSGPAFSAPNADQVAPGLTAKTRALIFSLTALNYAEAGLDAAAQRFMAEAMELDSSDALVLVNAASLAASQGRWERCRSLASKALDASPGLQQALYLKALALLETGVVSEAFPTAQEALRKAPEDYSTLLLNARVARAAKDFREEIRVLETMLSLVRKSSLPEEKVLLYLGQAWAQSGFPKQALAAYQDALKGNLTPAERKDVTEAIRTIERNRLPEEK